MIAVIQCAGSKQNDAASFCLNGETLSFIATPEEGEQNQVRPWDNVPGMNATWVSCVRAFNGLSNDHDWDTFVDAGITLDQGNAQMYQAGQLYRPQEYHDLVEKLGKENVYILSAGWGLVRSDRLLPDYDITFSNGARKTNKYITPKCRSDKQSLHPIIEGDNPVHLFITPNYLDYWDRTFAESFEAHDVLLHWHRPDTSRYRIELHDCGGRKTNWHYTAVNQFLENID